MNLRISTIPIRGLVCAEFLSLLGNQVAAVAIPILILQYTHSPVVAGIASAGNVIPIVIAALVGGRAIDRLGAWPVSVIADLLSSLSVLALPLAFIYFDHISPAIIFLLVFAGALFDPSGVAARQTMVPRLTRLAGKHLEKINTIRGGLENGADFIGPIVAVGLIGLIGSINTFFVNAASFLLCAFIIVLTVPRQRNKSKDNSDSNFLLGARFIFAQSQLKTLVIMGTIATFVILPFLALLLPVLATQVFDNAALLGVCLSAFGISATLGAFSFSRLSARYSRSFIYYGGLLLTGVAISLCGFVATQYGVVISAAIAGVLLGAGNPLEQTVLQEEASTSYAGQVFTSFTAIRFASGPLGLMLAGISTELANVNMVLILAGGLLIIAATAGWYLAPLQENLKRNDDRF